MSRSAGPRAVDLLERLVAIPSITGTEEPLLAFLEQRYLDLRLDGRERSDSALTP